MLAREITLFHLIYSVAYSFKEIHDGILKLILTFSLEYQPFDKSTINHNNFFFAIIA